jgi:predicted oxidoreductase
MNTSLISPRIQIAPGDPEFSRIVLGLWRLASWQKHRKNGSVFCKRRWNSVLQP